MSEQSNKPCRSSAAAPPTAIRAARQAQAASGHADRRAAAPRRAPRCARMPCAPHWHGDVSRRRRERPASAEPRAQRARSRRTPLPPITFPEALPVSGRRDEIAQAIARAPGRHRLRRNRLGQDHAAAEDLPGAGPRREGPDRPHAAAPHRRVVRRQAHRRRNWARRWARSSATRCASRTRCQPGASVKLMTDGILLAETQTDPLLQGLRHDHHRRGARAQPEHRLPARLPEADPAAPARPEGDRHLGDDRRRALRAPLRHAGQAGAGDRSVGPPVPGRGALPPGRTRPDAPRTGSEPLPKAQVARQARPDGRRRRRRRRTVPHRLRRRAGVPARRARDPRRRRALRKHHPPHVGDPAAVRAPVGGRSRTASSRPPTRAASCWRPTSPRPR